MYPARTVRSRRPTSRSRRATTTRPALGPRWPQPRRAPPGPPAPLGLAPGRLDRIEITFPDNSIQKTGLEVIFKGNDTLGGNDTNTGLAASNVFFWRHALADEGLTPHDSRTPHD